MNITPAWLGFLRGLGVVILFAVLTYIGDASHLAPLIGDSLAAILSGVVLALEHRFEVNNTEGKALFGAVRVRQ